MSAAAWPPCLAPIGRYIARAAEIKEVQPVVAYYCHLYALQLGLELRDTSSPAATTALNALLSTISELNKPLKIAPGDAAANAPVVQGFASAVFDAADAEDRGRGSDRGTARAFYAAVCFFEVCGYFGELPAALAERLAYARWKVADISKAVREGRVPRKGGPADWQRDARAAAAAGGASGAGGAVAAAPAGVRPDDDARRGGTAPTAPTAAAATGADRAAAVTAGGGR
ncbi:hypothetical protein BU14_0129s0004 [Porphyra umbilicalis]|uniref:Vta1/callose synthase N-terminal domain-containing protein n=1 Tax=Porphyra umbilicalis TaxID=2786 RepID=A0A1X6PAK3_PORUM|nr:hypothetical protein BU14_0129s0004 [Porphyra umbilicalis]|eukprot:OSX77888.1 hypothetical protein BU14_0129s0004 [Porphyra umbilicalis]